MAKKKAQMFVDFNKAGVARVYLGAVLMMTVNKDNFVVLCVGVALHHLIALRKKAKGMSERAAISAAIAVLEMCVTDIPKSVRTAAVWPT